MKKILISIPAYNEEENIVPLYTTIRKVVDPLKDIYDFEILFINDGSTDQTIINVLELINNTSDVSLIDLSRNYGKEVAMAAGFDYFEHDAMITMDADLQHPAGTIVEMIQLWEQGYEDVYAKRNKRKGEPWLKKKASKTYYSLLSKLSDSPVLSDAGDYRLLDKKVVLALRQLRESQRYTKGLYSWVGFKKVAIEFDAEERLHGVTKWSFGDLFKLAMEGITSYTTAPLKISMFFGFFVSIIAFVYMIYILVKTLILGADTSGFPTIVIIMLFLGGCQLISVGILGEYLARIFNETKERPLYFIENTYKKDSNINKNNKKN